MVLRCFTIRLVLNDYCTNRKKADLPLMMLVNTSFVPTVVKGLVTVTQFPDDRLVVVCNVKLVVHAGQERMNLFVPAYTVLTTGG